MIKGQSVPRAAFRTWPARLIALLQVALAPIQATMRAILEHSQRRYDQAQGLSDELLAL